MTEKAFTLTNQVSNKRSHARPLAVDLFSGAGGLSEGFTQAGFWVVFAIENDHHTAATYAYNHTRNKHKYRTEVLHKDISEIDFKKLHERVKSITGNSVDVVIGGPPCQGFSRANMRTRNSSNPLNKLVSHFICAIRGLKPRVVVMENVADMEIFEKGLFVEKLKSEFEDNSYKADWKILTASDFGVPQRRRRFFFIAAQDGLPIFFPKPFITQDAYVNVWDAISDLPELTNGNKVDELSYRKDKNLTPYQTMMRKKTNGRVQNNYVSENSDLVVRRYAHIPQGGNWQNIPEHLMLNYKDKTRCHNYIYRRLKKDETSIVITHYRKSMLIHPRENRGLSVREAARIQSFPDHFIFKGPLISQQQQVANAVPPLLAKAVAASVKKMLKYSKHES